MALGAVKGTWTFNATSIVANNQSTLATGSSTVARGDLIVVSIVEQTGNTSSGATDTLGNTYSAVTAGTVGGGVSGRAFYTVVTNPGTNTNINVAATASANNVAIVAACYEGSFTTIDANPANNNNTDNTSPFSGPATGALAQAIEIIINWRAQAGNAVLTATSPLLKSNQSTTAAIATIAIGGHVVNSTSTVTPAWTGTNPTGSQQGTASFRAASLPTGFKFDTLNRQYPYQYPLGLRSWTWAQQLEEEVEVQAPFSQSNWPLTIWPPYSAQLRTWVNAQQIETPIPPVEDSQPRAPHFTRPWELKAFNTDLPYNICLYGEVVEVVYPFKQTDWPLTPAAQQPIPILTVTYNPNLVGQDRLPNRQMDWPVPRGHHRQPDLMNWVDRLKLLLAVPFNQDDWPINRGPLQPNRSYISTFPRVLIGQDKLPTGADVTDLPPRDYQRAIELRTWIYNTSLALLAGPVVRPFVQSDWPINVGPKQPIQVFTASYNRNLIGQDQLPFRQMDWPTPVRRTRDAQTWVDRAKSYLQRPIRPIDWQNPRPHLQTTRTWINAVNLALTAGAARPFRQTDWPLARDARRLSDWVRPTNPNLFPPPPISVRPFSQYLWPLPGRQPVLQQKAAFWAGALFQPPTPPPPIPPPSRPTRMYVPGSEWQPYDRLRDWPSPLGWR